MMIFPLQVREESRVYFADLSMVAMLKNQKAVTSFVIEILKIPKESEHPQMALALSVMVVVLAQQKAGVNLGLGQEKRVLGKQKAIVYPVLKQQRVVVYFVLEQQEAGFVLEQEQVVV